MTRRKPDERLILHFHGLGATPHCLPPEEREYWCQVERFCAILDAISTLSRRIPIEITFDDGNMSDATVALPAMLARGMRGSFFVVAGRIGQKGHLDASAIRDLSVAGMDIGGHGWGHIDWRRADDRTLDVEIDDARRKLADIVSAPIDTVAIPFGSYDRRVLRRLRQSRLMAVYTSDGGHARQGEWLRPREVFRESWDDSRTLAEMAGSNSLKSRIRNGLARAVKRMR